MDKFKFSSRTIKGFYLGLVIFFFGSYVLAIGSIVLALMVQLGGVLATLGLTSFRMFKEIKNNTKRWALSAIAHILALVTILAILIGLVVSYSIQSKIQAQEGIVGDGSLTKLQQNNSVQNVADAIFNWREAHPRLAPNDLAIIEGVKVTDPNFGGLQNGSSEENNPTSLYVVLLEDESLYCLYLPPTAQKQKVHRIQVSDVGELHSAGEFAQADCEALKND